MSKKVCYAGSSGLSMNKALSILGIVALLIILTGIAQAEELSMYRQDPASTGNTNGGFSGDLELLWSYNTSDIVWEVSISSDGEYIAAGCFDDTVYFFNREGKLLWQYKTGTIVTSVSISSDGEYIAAGSASHSYISEEYGEAKVYLFNRAGKLLWSYEPDGSSVDKVSISSDGNYIVAGVEGSFKLYFFNKKGKLLWSREDIDPDDTSISSDGRYVVTSCCDQDVWGVCLFNKEGKLLWRYEVYDGPYSVSVSADGNYVTAGSDGKVYFFNRAGKLLWSYQHPEQRERYLFSIDVDAELEDDLKEGIFTNRLKNIFETKGIPLDENIISAIKNQWDIGEYSTRKEKGKIDFYRRYSGMYIFYTWISSNGNYVAAKTCGKLYFFNKDGELLWSFQTEGDPGSIWRGVSISLDGSYVVVGNYGDDHHYDGNLYFFNRNGELLGKYKTNTSVESASISSDGSYVALGTFNMVYCFVGSKRGGFLHMIKDAKSSIDSAKNFGAATAEAEKLLQQANSALNEEKYEDAKQYAGQAIESAEKAETMRWILYGVVIFLIAMLFIGYVIITRIREHKRRFEQGRKKYRTKRKDLIDKIDELINDESHISEKYAIDMLKKMRDAIAHDNMSEAEKCYELLDDDLSECFEFLK